MSDLTKFLLARIAEDEADPWRGAELVGADRVVGASERAALAAEEREWEARVLAECEAKRRIVERVAPLADSQVRRQTRVLALDAMLALAQPYADHPDFDPAWRLE